MIRVLLLLLFATLGHQSTGAQEILYSPYESFDLRTGDFSVVGRVGGRIYTYQASSDGFFLHAYDDSMRKKATVVLDFFPRRVGNVRIIAYPSKLIALYQTTEGRSVTQHAALMDAEGRLQGEPIEMLTVRSFSSVENAITTAHSDDRRTIVAYAIREQSSTELEFEGCWLNDELQQKGRVRARFDPEDNADDGAPTLSNRGTLYFPIFTSAGLKGYNDQVWIARIRPDSNRFDREEFRLNGLYAATPFLKIDNYNDRVYITGFYSAKKNGHFDGVLYGYYDEASHSIQSRRTIAFDDRIRTAASDRSKRRAFNAYDVRKLIVKNDGGFVMVGEENFITSRHGYTPGWGYYSFYYGPFMSPTVREYHYNDILALSYDAAGNREWHAFVRKAQYSQEDGGLFSSYALINDGSSLGFLFNDFNRTRSTIQLAKVDSAGGVDVHSFTTAGPGEPDWLPRSARQISAHEMVVPCLRRRQLCFAKIVL